jgi:hypothetical protein
MKRGIKGGEVQPDTSPDMVRSRHSRKRTFLIDFIVNLRLLIPHATRWTDEIEATWLMSHLRTRLLGSSTPA